MRYLRELAIGYVLGIVFLFVFLLSYSTFSRADDETLWLTTGEWSRHNHNQDCPWPGSPCHDKYRQNNTGIGIQFDLDKDSSFVAGWYNNSIYRETVYMGYTYAPWHIGYAKFGVMYATATGYAKEFPAVPISSLYGTYEQAGYGLNVFWVPTVVVAVQLKVRIK